MSKTLYIAEKPSLARAIFLGLDGDLKTGTKKGYYEIGNNIVTNCFGHMLEKFDPQDYDERYKKWSFSDLPISAVFPAKMKIKKDCKAQVSIIKGLLSECDVIVNAGDPDDEGSLLINELIEFFNCKQPVYRLLVSDLNINAVKKEIAKIKSQPNENYRGMSNAALARGLADQTFGYNLTRGFTLKAQQKGYTGVLHIGRVQSAVLGLINDRTLVNQGHVGSFYYNVIGNFNNISAKYKVTKGKDSVDEQGRMIHKPQAQAIKGMCENKDMTISLVETVDVFKTAPLPFSLSILQQQCSKLFGYKAKETLDILQSLYETHKLTTYPRSDCRYLSNEDLDNKEVILSAVFNNSEYLNQNDSIDLNLKNKAFDSSKITAHHAIRPTEKKCDISILTIKEKNVYELVCRTFVSLFMADSEREKTSIEITESINNYVFSTSKSIIKNKGWEILFGKDEDNEDNEDNKNIDFKSLKVGEVIHCDNIKIDELKTKPEKYFTESTLLAAMTKAAKFCSDNDLKKALESKDKNNSGENGSIGTEATRAGILEKILSQSDIVTLEKEKGYKEKVYKTTKMGQEFCAMLPVEIIKPDISAKWSMIQEDIRNGEASVTDLLSNVSDYISDRINDLNKNGVAITIESEKCPNCNDGILNKIKGANGYFWGCSNFKNGCKSAFPDLKGKPNLIYKPKNIQVSESEKCPDCGKGLIKRIGKNDKPFWGCSGYPTCKAILFDKNGKPNYEYYDSHKK